VNGRLSGRRDLPAPRPRNTPIVATVTGQAELLERDRELGTLAELLDAVARNGAGRLALVGGEAGAGKSELVRRFCAEHAAQGRLLLGACDSLFTPRPLGPILDIAETAGGELRELARGSARPHEIAAALRRELGAQAPTVVVLEDLHWADEATLDVVRLLGRRLDAVPALVIATYRDDELDRTHPLRIVLGEFGPREATRITVERLSPAAVADLAATHAVDPAELYRRTSGNPFFVTEALAAGVELPATVRDAVLARAARLGPEARAVLEAVAIVPHQTELWLLDALASDAAERLEECLASGTLAAAQDAVAFRHELARRAIEESLSPHRRLALHRLALAALAAAPAPDYARLVHHAEAAGDEDAVLRYAPTAGDRAAALGAHREAAAQYARALALGDRLSGAERADILVRRAHECYTTDENSEAVAALEEAAELYRRLGDRRHEGAALSALSDFLWCPGRLVESERAGGQAVTVLEALPEAKELAHAYCGLALTSRYSEKLPEAMSWGVRALELGRRFGVESVVIWSLVSTGGAEILSGRGDGVAKLEEALALAENAGLLTDAAGVGVQMSWLAVVVRDYSLVDRHLDLALARSRDGGLELFRLYLLAFRARSALDRGRWDEAVEPASEVLRVPRASTLPRITALVTLATVRARRGDPEVHELLDEAWELGERSGELPRIAPVAAARAETAWLEGRPDQVASVTDAALELARRRESPCRTGELLIWRARAGLRDEPAPVAEPYALQLAGDFRGAARRWAEIGCPYEAALALADADDEEALRESLAALQELGARPAAALVARRLRERGMRGLPRGPRPATQANPAQLTRREVDVVRLVAAGLRNAEIADRLVVSRRTVDHHVSAILRKLGARTRAEAGARAAKLGLLQDR
jgi:DNA-binding CsgD family transcriptional regulator